MSAYGIVRQSGAVRVNVDDFAVGYQSQLYECLEAVAYTAHKTVTAVKQLRNTLLYLGITEKRGYEFAAAVRLVAPRKATRYKDNLRFVKQFCKPLGATADAVGGEVVYYEYFGLRSGVRHRLRRIVFAVRAGEYGNKHTRLCRFYRRRNAAVGMI